MKFFAFLLIALVAVLFVTKDAAACSYSDGFQTASVACSPSSTAEECVTRLSPDASTASTQGSGGDRTAPDTPVLSSVVIKLTTDPAGTGCLSCPDLDELVITTMPQSPDAKYVLFYVGNTSDEATARTQVDNAVLLDDREPTKIDAVLGQSEGRERLGAGVLRAGKMCFAIELMDGAKNRSARSEVTCLDNLDENDSHVQKEDGSTACSTTRSMNAMNAGASAWLLPFGVVIARLLRRRVSRQPVKAPMARKRS